MTRLVRPRDRMSTVNERDSLQQWFESVRLRRIIRLYSVDDVLAQRGTSSGPHHRARVRRAILRATARAHAEGRSITTFGPYSPGQVVAMARKGIEGSTRWLATSAKGSTQGRPGSRPRQYPLNQVPDEAAVLVRALLTADKNQHFARAAMTMHSARHPAVNFLPFIIADADTGTAETRTSATSFVASSKRASPATTSRTRNRARRSAGIRVEGTRRLGRADQAAQRRAPAARHHGCRRHLVAEPMPRRRRCSRTPPTSVTSRSCSCAPTRGSALQGRVPGDLRRLHAAGVTALTDTSLCNPRGAVRGRDGVARADRRARHHRRGRGRYMTGSRSAPTICRRSHRGFFAKWEAEAGLTTTREAVADALDSASTRAAHTT